MQLTKTDCPAVYDPALVLQLDFEGPMGSLGLLVSASTLLAEVSFQLKAVLKLTLAPHEMVRLSTLAMEQSEALPNWEAWY